MTIKNNSFTIDNIKKILLFNTKVKFISKYANTTLVKSYYGYDQQLFSHAAQESLLDKYMQNCYITTQETDYIHSQHCFATIQTTNNINIKKLLESSDEHTVSLNLSPNNHKKTINDKEINHSPTINTNFTKLMLAKLINTAFEEKNNHRAYPSLANLYPIDIYLYLHNIVDLPHGFYKYQPLTKSLKIISLQEIDMKKLINFTNKTQFNNHFYIFYVYKSRTNYYKYGNAALIFATLECGMMMQTINLLSQSANLIIDNFENYHQPKILAMLGLNHYFGNYLLNVAACRSKSNDK